MLPLSVAIVGGGPGGLFTAHLLDKVLQRPAAITLMEASNRLGGKILTGSFAHGGMRYEAGAAEFYDYSGIDDDPLSTLVAELGLATVPLSGGAVMIDGRPLASLEDVRECLGAEAASALLAFDRAAHDAMTPREFYAADECISSDRVEPVRFDALLERISEPAARRYVEWLIHSDLATEPQRTTCSYGLQNYLMNDPAYMGLYAIADGNERLIEAIVSRISANVLLGQRVEEIGRSADQRLQVRWSRAGVCRSEIFDVVVIALPADQLAALAFTGPVLAAALRQHLAHHSHPAHYLRITCLFEQPFWRAWLRDSFAMLDQFGGCCLYDESVRHPGASSGVLGWLIGGSAAERMAGLTDEELVQAALDSLPSQLQHGRSSLIESRVHRWCSAVSAMPGGPWRLPIDRRHQPEPAEHPGLFLVGDYLFDSTLNGTLDSATHVAEWIAELAATTGRPRP